MKILPVNTYYKKRTCTSIEYAPNFCGKKLLTKPIIDICNFSHSDKTLDPNFLRNLLKLDSENISILQKYTKIKDKMLRAMGYNHPKNLKLIPFEDILDASFEVTQGRINISDKTMNMTTPMFIATLRHELEHFDQFVKIYKTMGVNAFQDALISIAKRLNPELNPYNININFNKNFYEIMSKDVDTTNFNAEKYYKAMYEYTAFSYAPSKAYKYYNNLLEKEAYVVERKILSSLGEEPVVSADTFPHNYEILVKLMNNIKVPLEYQDNVLQVLKLAAQIKSIETTENFKKIWGIWVNKQKNIEITPEEKKMLNKSLNKTNEIYCSNFVTLKQIQLDKECSKQIENWLRNSIWHFEDVLKET